MKSIFMKFAWLVVHLAGEGVIVGMALTIHEIWEDHENFIMQIYFQGKMA